MSVRKLNIIRVLNGYMTREVTSTAEIASIIGLNQRAVQHYMDLNSPREFKASDIAKLSIHFARMGYMELAYQFLPTDKAITPLRSGQAVGDLKRLTHEIARINGKLADEPSDPDKLKELHAGLEDVLADLQAEMALVSSRMQIRDEED